MRVRWDAAGFSVTTVHDHVMSLQTELISRLPLSGLVSRKTLQSLQPADIRSHTLVFALEDPQAASDAVKALLKAGVEIDCREHWLRMGFGFNHSLRDVCRAVEAAEWAAGHMAGPPPEAMLCSNKSECA